MPGPGFDTTDDGVDLLAQKEVSLGVRPALRERFLPLESAVKLAALLFCEGASVGLCLWSLGSDGLARYALENELPIEARRALIQLMVALGVVAVLGGLTFLLRARRDAAARLTRGALELSPLLVSGFLPLGFQWQLWASRETTFGVFTCVLGLGFFVCLKVSAEALRSDPSEGLEFVRRALSRLAARTEGWVPPLIVALAATFYTLYFSYHTIQYHRSVLTMSYDLGLENNLLWNTVHFGGFMKSSPLSGPHGTHFGFHATLFAYVIGIFYYFYQQPEMLLAFQAALIGFAAVPLYLFARSHIGRWAASLCAVLYVLYPPVHGSNLYDFHYLPLGVFFLWLTLWLVDAGRYKWAALAVILTLSVREDVAADLVVMGAFAMFAGRRPRAGMVVAGVAAVYFLVMKMMIMPRFLDGAQSFIHQWKDLVPAGGHGYGGVLMTVLGNPVYTLTSLLETDKFLYLVQIGAPFCFLVWRRPIGFFVSLPGFFFTLLSTKYPPLVQISFQYTAHWTAFLFVGFIATLRWLRAPKFPGDDGGFRRQRIWLAAACFTTLLTSYQYGAILQTNTARGGFGKYKFGMSDSDRQRYADLLRLVGKVPPLAKISAAEFVVPHVSSRPDAYTLRNGIYDAEYVLWESPARDDERHFVHEALKGPFGVVASSGPFVLAKRGYDKSENQLWLKTR